VTLSWPYKDKDEVLDYVIDWAARLSNDIIFSSTWIVPTGIVMDSNSNTDSSTTIWLHGGTIGSTYELLNRIVTTGGRTMDQSVKLKIKEK
jgi:hypothetical protein